ncbi:hypothetical protein [uncultured Cyclobacterium sp.]|uniref:hypothetical protein n=1 Tax=uncultured Cyclobacterium sp. TaxID=453820 RepID=UPI0030EF308A|tara:strand:+ start:453 stop:1196 length:744 start_codon:yes stop_codon:yes gene_type:complete
MKKSTRTNHYSEIWPANGVGNSSGLWALLLSPFLLFGCLSASEPEPEIIIEPPYSSLIGTDTITSGDYKHFSIGTNAENAYAAVNLLKEDIGLDYINVVANIYSGMAELEDKLPLYHYIFMDEEKGTSTGVQLGISEDRIATIFLGNGEELEKWPTDLSQSAIRKGDEVASLFDKLETISQNEKYKKKFEAINLLTKDLSKPYDSQMSKSPQWYFGYTLADDKMDVVKLNFEEGILQNMIINHFETF